MSKYFSDWHVPVEAPVPTGRFRQRFNGALEREVTVRRVVLSTEWHPVPDEEAASLYSFSADAFRRDWVTHIKVET